MPWNLKNHPHFPKPKDKDGYFESMSKVVFSTGLNWSVVEKKWPDIKKLFSNFSVEKVAKYDSEDINKLLSNEKMIRSGGKINAIIKNARAILAVEKEFGAMGKYLATMQKQGVENLLKDLKRRFSYLGDSTSIMFLYGVGEESPELEKMMMKAHRGKSKTSLRARATSLFSKDGFLFLQVPAGTGCAFHCSVFSQCLIVYLNF